MVKNKSAALYIAFIIAVGILSFASHLFFSSHNDLLSKKKKTANYYAYNDSSSQGNSLAALEVDTGNQLILNYQLLKGFAYPYAGVSIEPPTSTGFDFSTMDELVVEISAKHGTKIPISLMVFDSLYSQKDVPSSFLTFQYTLNTANKQQSYRIPFHQFSIPDWWYKEHHIKHHIAFSPSQHQINSINVENCSLLQTGVQDQIKITTLFVEKKSSIPLYILTAGFVLLIAFKVKNWLTKKKTLRIEYAASPMGSSLKKNSSSIDYIAKNYQDPELSLTDIKENTGLNESRISEEIKAKTNLSFKQYLNAIRLEEAKNLLINSEKSISEIAYQVGYNNVSHFNRVFKQIENCSPGDYRKNEKS